MSVPITPDAAEPQASGTVPEPATEGTATPLTEESRGGWRDWFSERGRPSSTDYDFASYAEVNLMPARVQEQEEIRHAKIAAATVVACSLLVTGGMWVMATNGVASAQAALDEATTTQIQLQNQLNAYAEVPKVFAAADLAEVALYEAMGPEIRWSWVLNDLSYLTPQGVSLETMTAQLTAGSFAVGSNGGPVDPSLAVAALTYDGEALNYPMVTAWLAALDRDDTYLPPTLLTAATRGEDGLVTFNTQALLSPEALSGRYVTEAAAAAAASSALGDEPATTEESAGTTPTTEPNVVDPAEETP